MAVVRIMMELKRASSLEQQRLLLVFLHISQRQRIRRSQTLSLPLPVTILFLLAVLPYPILSYVTDLEKLNCSVTAEVNIQHQTLKNYQENRN